MTSHTTTKISLRRNIIGTFVFTNFHFLSIGLPVCLLPPARIGLGIRSYVGSRTPVTGRRETLRTRNKSRVENLATVRQEHVLRYPWWGGDVAPDALV